MLHALLGEAPAKSSSNHVHVVMQQSPAVTWTSVPMTEIGSFDLQHTGTLAYDIPSVIPDGAWEVLVLATAHAGCAGPNDCVHYIKIYTQENSDHYEKYVVVKSYNQDAWSTNSDNLWFPITSDRKIFVEFTTDHSGRMNFTLHAIGHR